MKDFDKELTKLRNKALELIKNGKISTTAYSSNLEELIEELNIYQIELTLQNEELLISNQKLIDEKIKNDALFEFAPIPYFILKSNGIIVKLNNSAREFLQVNERKTNFAIFRFLTEDSKIILHKEVKFIEDHNESNFNLKFLNQDGKISYTLAKLNSFWNEEQDDFLLRMTIIDLTENEANKKLLLEKESRLSSVFNNNNVGILLFDKFGRLNDANQKILTCLGISSKELIIGMSIYDLPGLSYELINKMKNSESFKVSSTFNFNDLKFKRSFPTIKTGTEYFDITISKDQIGEYNLFLSNITERVQLDTQVKVNEQRYKELFDNVMDGFAIHEIITNENDEPTDYIFLDVNKKFESITGLKRDKILNKSVLQVLPNTEKFWIETYGKVALTGVPVSFTNYAIEFDKYFEVRAYSTERRKFAVIFQDKSEEIHLKKKALDLDGEIKQILELAPITILEVDDSSRYLWVNEHAKKTLEYTLDEFKNMFVQDLVNSDTQDTIDRFRNYLVEGIDKDIYDLKTKSGEIKTFVIEAKLIRKRKFAFCIEITDMLKHKVRFEKLEQDYINIMKNIDFTIIMVDKSYNVIDISGAYFEKNLQEKELFINKKIFEIFPEAEQEMNLYQLNQALNGKQSTFTIERQVLDETRYFEIRYNPYFVGDEIKGVIATSIDTTENIRLMNQMIESENRLKQIFENNEDIFWIMEESSITYISPNFKQTFDTTNYETINNLFESFVILDDKVKFTKFLSKLQSNMVPAEQIEFRVKIDDSTTWLMIQAFRVYNASSGSKITGFIRNINKEKAYLLEKENFINDLKILQAINENKNKELQKLYNEISEKAENLRISNEIKDSLFSIIAHDLRNPIFGIKSLFSELSQIIGNDDSDVVEMTNALNVSMEGLTDLLENLIFWSKLESNKITFEPSKILLRKIVDDSVRSHKIMGDVKKLTIINNIDNNLEVFGDRKLLPFIFNNLLSNAIKYSYNNSEIILSSEIFENYVRIWVQDFGIGLSEDLINKISSNSSLQSIKGTKGEQGTGFGLSTIIEFIKMHGSELRIESEVGKGSKFYFDLYM